MKKFSLKKIKKIFKKIIGIFIFLATIISAYSLTFSEIMYNPQGSDTGREWIELSNPNCDNLEEYKLFENNINHNINIYSDGECMYPIICDDCGLFLLEYNTSSIIYESSFTLSNTGEYLGLKLNGTTIDSVNYTELEGIEGMSITKYDGWENTIPTPGYYISQNNETNETINTSTNITINTTINISINITVNTTINTTINDTNNETINETINQTINMTLNQTSNATINQTINITSNETTQENNSTDICNVSIGIRLKDDKSIYYNKESIKFYNTLNISPNHKSDYAIEYWIEDIYGNILKSKVQTSNLNEKSYTPSVNEKTVAIIIKNQLINISCESAPARIINETSEKLIVIKNPDYIEKECKKCETYTSSSSSDITTKTDSELSLEIQDNNLIIGAYRGDDRKYVVNAYVKNDKNRKIADLVKLNLDKYSGVNIELPLELDTCGEFDVFTEGLGFLESEKYYLDCEQAIEKEAIVSNTSEKYEKDLSIANEGDEKQNAKTNVSQFFHDPLITGNIIYESKNEKTKEYSLIGILVLIAGSTLYIVYKRIIRKNH